LATAADAAGAAAEAAGSPDTGASGGEAAAEGAQGGALEQGDQVATGDQQQGQQGAPAAAKPVVSETVRLARELRRAQTRLAELEKRGAPAPVQQHAQVTREQVIAELRKKYEEDPEALLQEVGGEDFYAAAKRVQTRNEAPETKIQQLERELAELKGKTSEIDKHRQDEERRKADQLTEQHLEVVNKAIEEQDAEGNFKYPTLATLDPDVLEEPVAKTAYNAVVRAWTKECTKVDAATGNRVIIKKWSDADQEARFQAAFKALDEHYSRIRTPRSRNQEPQRTQDPEFSPTISTSTSSGLAERPVRAAKGTKTVDEALRDALKEAGLS
jgi:hypothetical protein